mgnify:CR=1 FL=1
MRTLAALNILERAGAKLVDVRVDGGAETHAGATTMVYSDACAFHAQRLRDAPEQFDAQVVERMKRGLEFTGTDYARAADERMRWKRSLARLFGDIDMLASPTVHTRVPLIHDSRSLHAATRDSTRNTYAGAFGQIPGLSIPCGNDSNGLPIGLQLEAKWWGEPLLLRAGYAFQQATDWHQRLPPGVPE